MTITSGSSCSQHCYPNELVSDQNVKCSSKYNTVEPRYLELAYLELPLISKRKSGPCFNMKL